MLRNVVILVLALGLAAAAWLILERREERDKPRAPVQDSPKEEVPASRPEKSAPLDALLAEAREHRLRDEGALVLETLEKAVEAHPKSATALALRGVARAAHAYYGYRTAPTSDADKKACYWTLASGVDPSEKAESYRERLRQDFRHALADVENAVAMDRVDPRNRVCRGVVYLWRSALEGEKNLEKAVEEFTHALLLDSNCADAYFYRALANYLRIGHEDFNRLDSLNHIFLSDVPIGGVTADWLEDARRGLEIALFESVALDVKTLHALVEQTAEATGATKRGDPPFFLVLGSAWKRAIFSRPAVYLSAGLRRNFTQRLYALNPSPPRELSPKRVFDLAKRAVVYIYKVERDDAPSIGTGFIPCAQGYIVTNEHVVRDAVDGKVRALLFDRTWVVAQVARTDKRADLAILVVRDNEEYLRYASANCLYRKFADPPRTGFIRGLGGYTEGRYGEARIGTTVVSIGHPKGLPWSMTSGIISQSRLRRGVPHYQTDTAINPGNSGGPLLDLHGRVVGVASFILGNSEGLNFAVTGAVVHAFVHDYLWKR